MHIISSKEDRTVAIRAPLMFNNVDGIRHNALNASSKEKPYNQDAPVSNSIGGFSHS